MKLTIIKEKTIETPYGKEGPNELVLELPYLKRTLSLYKFKEYPGTWYTPIPSASMYYIGLDGTIITQDGTEVKSWLNSKKYSKIVYYNDFGMTQHHQTHRVVLSTFRPIFNSEKYHVNHFDANPTNNALENLEWCTNGQNKQHIHAIRREFDDPSIPVGVCIRNVLTGEYKEFNHIYECAKYLNMHKDSILTRLEDHPIDKIWADGWQFKRRQDTRKWKDVTDEDLKLASNGLRRPVSLFDMCSNAVLEFRGLDECALYLKIPLVTLYYKLTEQEGPKAHCRDISKFFSGLDALIFQVKYKFDNTPWKKYPTMYHTIADLSNMHKPIYVLFPDNTSKVFITLTEASDYLKIGKTTIHYRLSNPRNTPWPDGLIIRYYLEYYSELNHD